MLGDKLGLAVHVAVQIYLMFNQELELEAENNGARIRVAANVATLARFMEWIKVVSRITSRVDMNLPKAKALIWRHACHECLLREMQKRALPRRIVQGNEQRVPACALLSTHLRNGTDLHLLNNI